MIDRWAQLASVAPRVVNFVNRAPGVSHLLRKVLGLASQRHIPRFASTSFQRWARKQHAAMPGGMNDRTSINAGDREVILWADTFNNYFHPETGRAAAEVLKHAGFRVTVPTSHLCCGRPLYDFGMIRRAKKYLRHIMRDLGSAIDAGVPIVVLEPSCASVFRDELRNLFPTDGRAMRLRNQTFLLSEFLQHHAPGYQPPQFSGTVLLHGHCHHKALMKMEDEESLLRRMGSDLKSVDSGCCGMAGPFRLRGKQV